MKNPIKKLTAAGIAVFAIQFASGAVVPEVTGVTMTQATSSRLVTISYTLADAPAVITLDVQTNATEGVWASIGGAAVCNAQGDVWKKVETGNRTIVWRPDLSWPDHKITDGGARAVVTAWSLDNTPNYMVVDISASAKPNTQTYYPAADFVPGGVTNSEYKVSALLMRKISAKDVTWTMGSAATEPSHNANEATHRVTLSSNYYIGVYEITQGQYGEVATNSTQKANFSADGLMRPMENIAYRFIRNDVNNKWVNDNYPGAPHVSSFLGLLRLKSGLDFDLPSEAQWEFAARAGNGSGYWGDGSEILGASPDTNLNRLGRNIGNNPSGTAQTATLAPDVGGTAIVGSYQPNAWGLYDMHGNVWETCLDWYEDDIASYGGAVNVSSTDPTKPISGASVVNHVIRGGSWWYGAAECRPAYRLSLTYNQASAIFSGFRVVCAAGLE